MTIFAPPRAGSRSASLPGISTTSRSKESTASLVNTVSAELPNLVHAGGPYRRRRDQRRIARYSSEEVAVYECVDRRRLQ